MTLRCQPRSWLRNGPQFSSTLRKVSHPVGQSFTRSRPVSCRHNPPLVQYSGFSDAYPARRNLRRIHRRHRTIHSRNPRPPRHSHQQCRHLPETAQRSRRHECRHANQSYRRLCPHGIMHSSSQSLSSALTPLSLRLQLDRQHLARCRPRLALPFSRCVQ